MKETLENGRTAINQDDTLSVQLIVSKQVGRIEIELFFLKLVLFH